MLFRQIINAERLKSLNLRNFIFRSKSQEHINLAYATYEITDSKQKAPPLILLHGLLGSKSNWSTLCTIYQSKTNPNRKIIALDARNHGESFHNSQHTYEALSEDLKNFLDTFHIEKACILGHSMGGGTAMLFSLKHPKKVEKLIVCDFSPYSNNLGDLRSYLEAMEKVQISPGMQMSAARASAEFQLQKFGIRHRSRRKFLTTNLVGNSDGTFRWRVNLPALKGNLNELKKISLGLGEIYDGPTLFIGGTNSGYLKHKDFPQIRNIFPNSELKIIEGAGHWVHFDKRKEFAAVSLNFLNKTV